MQTFNNTNEPAVEATPNDTFMLPKEEKPSSETAKRSVPLSLASMLQEGAAEATSENEASDNSHLPKSEIMAVEQYIKKKYDSVRTNKLTKRIELEVGGVRKELTDRIVNEWMSDLWKYRTYVNTVIRRGKEEETIKKVAMDKTKLYTLVDNERFAPTYDPIEQYFKQVAPLAVGTTATPEIDKFIACFTCENDLDVVDKYFKKWLSGVFVNYFTENDKSDEILILQSGQGTGKTTAIEYHLLKPFRDYVVKNFQWNSNNKDEMIKLATSFVIFDDELSAMKKSEVEELKKITSYTVINNVRAPYARTPENHIRRASFIGATNNTSITNDSTGTRRFLILGVKAIDLDAVAKIDYDMLWSEAYNHFHIQGNKVHIDFKQIEDSNMKYKCGSAEEEYLERHFDFAETGNTYMSATEVFDLLKAQYPHLNTDLYKIGKALRGKGVEPKSVRIGGGTPAKRYFLHRIKDGGFEEKQLTVIRSNGYTNEASPEPDDWFTIKKAANG